MVGNETHLARCKNLGIMEVKEIVFYITNERHKSFGVTYKPLLVYNVTEFGLKLCISAVILIASSNYRIICV